MRKADCRRPESVFSPLSIDGRKSREAGLQTRAAKSLTAWPLTAAESRCHAHGVWRTASWALKWQVRTCGKQPIVEQKATSRRSVSVAGRVATSKAITARQADEGAVRSLNPKARAGNLNHFGSSRIATIIKYSDHMPNASSRARGRLRGRDGRHSSGSSYRRWSKRVAKGL